MNKVENTEKSKQQRLNGSTPEGSPESSPVLAPAAAMQVDSLGATQPGEQTSTSLDVSQVPPPSTPPGALPRAPLGATLGAPLGAPPPTETDDLCEDDLKMVNKLLDDINNDDLTRLNDDEFDNLIDVTGLNDVVTGDQSDGFLDASEPPKTPTARRITRNQVIERLKELLKTPQKPAGSKGSYTGMEPRNLSSFSPDSSQENPSSAPAAPAPAPAARPPASSSAARATGLSPLLAVSSTPQLATSCSNANFLEVLAIYLNIKKKRWNLPQSSSANCWENLFIMYEKRGFKPGFGDRIVEYSKSKLFDQTSFSRNVFQRFVIDCVDFGVAEQMKSIKNVGRDAFPGEQLKNAAVDAANARGEFYYKSPQDVPAGKPKVKLKPEEVDWIKVCIGKRNQLWIDNPGFVNDSGGPDYEKSKQDMKAEINKKYSSWTYWKQVCGICWICKKPIYFYYMTKNEDGTGEKIDLNTQCGQIEHVLPPTVGDIFGTLHTSASMFRKVVAADGTETMYTYGLEPSHAFCNQMKGMFVFTPIFFGGDVEYQWSREAISWFRNERYDSFEFYPGFIKTWRGFKDVYSSSEARCYAETTHKNVNNYLKQNIIPILREQAEHQGHTMKSVTQLKLAIFCQKFAYEHSDIFKTKWDGKDSSDAARGTPGRR